MNGWLIREIAEKFGTPVYLFDKNRILKNFRLFQKVFDIVAYPYKTNTIPALIKIFHELGAWAEVASQFELELAKRLEASKILYNPVCKPVFDSDTDIIPVVSDVRLLNLNRAFGVRISYGKSRFGMDPKRFMRSVKNREFSLNNLILLHVHVGTNIMDVKQHLNAVEMLLSIRDEIVQAGGDIEYIDVGGGFPTNPTLIPFKKPPELDSYLDAIKKVIRKAKVKVIAEPGRALLNPGSYLLTRVMTVKKNWIFVDAGTTMLPSAGHLYHEISKVGGTGRLKRYNVAGCLCFEEDIFALDRELPEVKEGDLLLIHDAGAYSINLAPRFIELRPPAVLVDGDEFKLIARRENVEDFLQLCI